MKKWYLEQYSFKITVLSVGDDGNPRRCRNGHEVGDTYECGYGCPDGFCSKTASRLFRMQEIIRSGGDLRNLISGAEKNRCEIICPDHVVKFRIDAKLIYSIKPLTDEHLPVYADIIRKSFATVADSFGWTEQIAPTFTAYISHKKLRDKYIEGYYPFGLFVGDVMVGFVSLTDMSEGVYELNNLAVLPQWRHSGYGKLLLDFCKNRVNALGGSKITIGIVEENTVLKCWYMLNGFTHTGTKKFDWQPFTAGFMEYSSDGLYQRESVQDASMICESETPYTVNAKERHRPGNKKLAIGIQDFRSLREKSSYYVDKTQMIPEFLDSEYQVTLVTRPRRFGKSLNMSMLAEFLDYTKDSGGIFAGTKVSKSNAMREMNSHPVIFISFLNVKGDTADILLYRLMSTLELEYRRYLSVIQDKRLPDQQREKLQNIYRCLNRLEVDGESRSSLADAIPALCQALVGYYGKKAYLLIDEYDTPFIAANAGGYYDEVRDLLGGLLGSSLKGNLALEKAMLTGIQRVAKENIFSGLNNLTVCTVNDSEYSDCFGFTEDETGELLQCFGMGLTKDVKAMYNGYLFGTAQVYNPWSVTSYAVRKRLEPYWVNTSENSIIRNALSERSASFITDYERLIKQGYAEVLLELATSYYEQPDDASLWGLLVNAGLLTVMEYVEDDYYLVRVPNYEVRRAFQNLTAYHLKVQEGHITKLVMNLKRGRMKEFAEEYQRVLLEIPSYHDLKDENSYHMMMLGMCAFMYKDYEVRSNRESGRGRSDILLCAKKAYLPHIILEFKYTKDASRNLEELAQEAITQIKEQRCDAGMIGQVYYVGLAHCGKKAEVKWDYCN